MSGNESREQRAGGGGDPDEMSGLHDVVAELRADVPIRSGWRNDVLRKVDAFPSHRRRAGGRRRLSLSPPAAIAAALAFAALGAAATASVLTLRDDEPRFAALVPPAIDGPPSALRPQPVRFALVAPGASRVSLVGDFNRWDASATPMRPHGDGRLWMVEVPLPPGRHVYAFVVDGDVTPDPAAPRAGDEDFGVPSSVVLVGLRGS